MRNKSRILPRRVRFSDGGIFETSAEKPSDYLLDTKMIRFVFISIVLFSAFREIGALGSTAVHTKFAVWFVVFAVTLLWLLISVSISISLFDRGYISAIFTPVIVLPLAILIILPGHLAWLYLGVEVVTADETLMERIVQNIIALICLDIFHGRYVAPTHPTYVAPQSGGIPPTLDAAAAPQPAPFVDRRRPEPVAQQASAEMATPSPAPDNEAAANREAGETAAATGPATGPVDAEKPHQIQIANEAIQVDKIRFIKSEDHFLRVALPEKNLLLRGKLSETIPKIDINAGMQINRSVWIAYAAIEQVKRSAKGHTEIVVLGETFRVASSRKLVFEGGFESFKSTLKD